MSNWIPKLSTFTTAYQRQPKAAPSGIVTTSGVVTTSAAQQKVIQEQQIKQTAPQA